jgi:hypothetical protein
VSGVALFYVPSLLAVFSGEQTGRPRQKVQRSQKARFDYSRFSHTTHVEKKKLTCDSCHKFPTKNWNEVRKGDTAFPDVAEFPEHSTCLDCHRQQFFARERPAPAICSNCHVAVTPRDTARFLFPSLGDVSSQLKQKPDLISEFAINFPHDKHLEVVGLATPRRTARDRFVAVAWQQKAESTEPKSCPVCHQTYQPQGNSDEEYVTKPPKDIGDNFWLKKGTFKTIPNSHMVCFSCHNVDAGIPPLPSDCNSCHKLRTSHLDAKTDFDLKLAETIGVADKTIMAAWQRRKSSGAFRHDGGEHPNIGCLNCHNVTTLNTTDPKSSVVPVRTCGGAEGCHITATSDDGGILNYEIDQKRANASFVCTKCHLGFGKETTPASHVDVIVKAKK